MISACSRKLGTFLQLMHASELMKNSKITDRQLAGKLGISQPAVTRRRLRLEKGGIIKEYTLIPEFTKLDYHILSITLFKYGSEASEQVRKGARPATMRVVEAAQTDMVIAEQGMGIG